MSNRTYILSTKDEDTSENMAPMDVVIALKRSASICSAFNNDERELKIIELENKDEIEASPTISVEEVLPKVMSKNARPKAAKGVRTSMNIADRVTTDFSHPGEVVTSDEYLSRAKMPLISRTQLTVPPIKSVQQIYLDN